ncbi:hypothetical protein LguiA_002557 [Lonicera macranthoides]
MNRRVEKLFDLLGKDYRADRGCTPVSNSAGYKLFMLSSPSGSSNYSLPFSIVCFDLESGDWERSIMTELSDQLTFVREKKWENSCLKE